MKYYKPHFLFLLFSFVLNQHVCSQKNYFEQRAFPIDVHDHKKQLSVSVGWEKGFDLGLSYSLTDHISMFGSGAINKKTSVHTTFLDLINISMDDRYCMSGLNYSLRFNSDVFKRLNLYTAFSFTRIRNYWNFLQAGPLNEVFSPYTNAHYNSGYFGADIMYENQDMEVAWTFRYCHSSYAYLVFNNGDPTNLSSNPVSTVNNLRSNNLESYVSIGGKWKELKISGQLGGSVPFKEGLYAWQTDKLQVGPDIFVSGRQEFFNQTSIVARLSLQYNLNFRRKN